MLLNLIGAQYINLRHGTCENLIFVYWKASFLYKYLFIYVKIKLLDQFLELINNKHT